MHQLRSVISYPLVALQQRATIRKMPNLISPSALRFVVLCMLYERIRYIVRSLNSPFTYCEMMKVGIFYRKNILKEKRIHEIRYLV